MKRLCMLTALLALFALAAGCGSKPADQQAPAAAGGAGDHGSAGTSGSEPGSSDQPAPVTPETRVTVTVYYADATLSGLASEQREIAFSNPEEKYEKVLELLGQPQDEDHEPLWKDFRYHSVRLEDGKLTIDAKGDNPYELGGGAEAYAIDALTKTMFQFPEVETVQILVDGKQAESLMGHVDISEPFTR